MSDAGRDPSRGPRFDAVLERMFYAALILGGVCALAWTVFWLLGLGGGVATGIMSVVLAVGGGMLTHWVNERWLAYATKRRLPLPDWLGLPLRVIGGVAFALGWMLLFTAMIGPGSVAPTAGVLDKYLQDQWPLRMVLYGVQAGAALMLVYGGALGVNAARRMQSSQTGKVTNENEVTGQAIYFRSFRDDASPAYMEGLLAGYQMKTEEEMLVAAVGATGLRCYAIGRPGEPLPELGARRFYLADDVWHESALRFMQSADWILIRPNGTPSILWEIEQMVQTVHPCKLTLWIPPTADWRSFVRATEGLFPHGLPEALSGDFLSQDSFILFDLEWKPFNIQTLPTIGPALAKQSNRSKRLKMATRWIKKNWAVHAKAG